MIAFVVGLLACYGLLMILRGSAFNQPWRCVDGAVMIGAAALLAGYA